MSTTIRSILLLLLGLGLVIAGIILNHHGAAVYPVPHNPLPPSARIPGVTSAPSR